MRYVQLQNPVSIPAPSFSPSNGSGRSGANERDICAKCEFKAESACESCMPQCAHPSVLPYNAMTQPLGIVGKCPIGFWDRRGDKSLLTA